MPSRLGLILIRFYPCFTKRCCNYYHSICDVNRQSSLYLQIKFDGQLQMSQSDHICDLKNFKEDIQTLKLLKITQDIKDKNQVTPYSGSLNLSQTSPCF